MSKQPPTQSFQIVSFFLVFIGGGMGSLARFGLGQIFPYSGGFPWATFLANLLACFLLGIFLGWASKADMASTNQIKWLLVTGFCGGFSTFSTFSNESLSLLKSGQWPIAFLYIGLSLITGLAAVALGWKCFEH